MDPIYPTFAAADPLFYDRPLAEAQSPTERHALFEPSRELEWESWDRIEDAPWSMWMRPETHIPEQGWKVHLSAVQANAHAILSEASKYCHRAKLPFKFLRTRADLERSLAKDAERGSAGKFITIYTPHEDSLLDCLLALDSALGGSDGPYILSDLRWNAGPVHVRYGGFRRRSTIVDGHEVLAIRDPRTGTLAPDPREAGFRLPAWIDPPAFIREQIERLESAPPEGFPEITGALHFSNAGGVYAARLGGDSIVLKEARPHAGWTPDGRNAVDRLMTEERALRAAETTVRVPHVHGVFEAFGHRFLALERLPGRPLSEIVTFTNPLTISNATHADFLKYRDWALSVLDSLRKQVLALHTVGLAHGDLHPGNVLVDESGAVGLIDLEMSVAAESETEAVLGARGFVSRGLSKSSERDLYALACTELHAFLPLTPLIDLHREKSALLVSKATELFALPPAWVDRIESSLGGVATARQTSTISVLPSIERVARRLCQDATPEREDRLWPGDPRQFDEPLLSVAHGPLGIWVALDRARVALPQPSTEWVKRTLRQHLPSIRNGLMDGRSGALWACRQLGLHDEADRLAEELLASEWAGLTSDLYSGLPGVGLAMLAEADRDPASLSRAAQILSHLEYRRADAAPPSRVPLREGGLMGGATGTALLALRLYEATRDDDFLRSTRSALAFDLASLREGNDGSLQVNEGWRTLPYLGYGSVGIGMVLVQYLNHAPQDEQLRAALRGVTIAACTPFTVQAGLLSGRAGLIHYLSLLETTEHATAITASSLNHHVNELMLHALPDDRFAGDGLLRASCDLATGSAGVLAALLAAPGPGRELSAWCPIPYLSSPPAASIIEAPTRSNQRR